MEHGVLGMGHGAWGWSGLRPQWFSPHATCGTEGASPWERLPAAMKGFIIDFFHPF
jgi:hypothetical protein